MGAPETIAIVVMMLVRLVVPAALVVGGLWLFARTRTGRDFVRRIGGRDVDPVLVHQLAEEVSALREELTAVQERLDFTERVLVESRTRSES